MIEDMAAYQHAWYLAHRDAVLERNRRHDQEHKAEKEKYRRGHKDERVGYDAVYYAEHRDAKREQHHAYYLANKEAIAEHGKEYRQANRDAVLARLRAYSSTHKEERAEYHRRYWEENKERLSENNRRYLQSDSGRAAARKHSRKRAWSKRASGGADYTTFAMIEARCEMWGNKCYICGAPMQAIDHVKPLAKGGLHLPCNIRPICTSCNCRKRDTWPYKLK